VFGLGLCPPGEKEKERGLKKEKRGHSNVVFSPIPDSAGRREKKRRRRSLTLPIVR